MENNLEKSTNQLEQKTQISNVTKSIALALERTGQDGSGNEGMIMDIVSEFHYVPADHLKKAIRNGSFGHYGKTYRMCTQEICMWIFEYIKDNPDLESEEMHYIQKMREARGA